MIRLTLTAEDHAALQALRRDPRVRPAERDRVEMVLLSASGWSPPRIAAHVSYNPATVRRVLVQFRQRGVTSLHRRPPGPPPDTARREQVEAALTTLLDRDRTWTAPQLAAALTEEGISLSTRQTRKYLGRIAAWRRTLRTLRHKQNSARVERAKTVLGSLKKKRRPAGSGLSTLMNVASPPANP